MEAYLKSLELGNEQRFIRAPKFRGLFVAAGLGMVFYAVKMEIETQKERALAKLKKERMAMPVYELSEEEMVNPPWVKNFEAWRYRRVKFAGRAIHGKAFYVPTRLNQYSGFAKITPFVTNEDEFLENRSGILVNEGFVPHEYGPLFIRNSQNSFGKTQVTGVVNKAEDLDRSRLFRGGNAYNEPRWVTNHLDLRQFAAALGYKNQAAMSKGVVEVINMDLGFNFDKPDFVNRDLTGIEQVPFARTPAGFVNSESNSLERRWKQLALALAGAAIAASA